MRSLLWFLLGLVVAISGQALADPDFDVYGRPTSAFAPKSPGWVDNYGLSADHLRGFGSQPGQLNYRDSTGTTHYPPSSRNPC